MDFADHRCRLWVRGLATGHRSLAALLLDESERQVAYAWTSCGGGDRLRRRPQRAAYGHLPGIVSYCPQHPHRFHSPCPRGLGGHVARHVYDYRPAVCYVEASALWAEHEFQADLRRYESP